MNPEQGGKEVGCSGSFRFRFPFINNPHSIPTSGRAFCERAQKFSTERAQAPPLALRAPSDWLKSPPGKCVKTTQFELKFMYNAENGHVFDLEASFAKNNPAIIHFLAFVLTDVILQKPDPSKFIEEWAPKLQHKSGFHFIESYDSSTLKFYSFLINLDQRRWTSKMNFS